MEMGLRKFDPPIAKAETMIYQPVKAETMIYQPVKASLSVVIPAKDVEDWIGPTLESVLTQDRLPSEIIVIDDGSADRTADVAQSYGPKVRVISQRNAGLSAARNTGASKAKGDVLLFLDADDVLLPGTIARALSTWERTAPSAAVCVPNHIRASETSRSLAWPPELEARILGRNNLPALLRSNFLLANSFVIKDIWEHFRFDERLLAVEDLDFYARLLIANIPIVMLGEPGVVMAEQRAGSLTSRTRLMRAQRRIAFGNLSTLQGLTFQERVILFRNGLRARVGQLFTKSDTGWRSPPDTIRILHVLLDQPGGGPHHVSLLSHHVKSSAMETFLWATDSSLTRPFASARQIIALRRTIRSADFHIVHAHGVRVAAWVSAAIGGSLSVKKVVTVHGLHSIRRTRGATARVAIWLNRMALSRFDRVIALSHSDRAEISTKHLARAADIRLIEPAIEPGPSATTDRTSDPIKVLWMGRFVQQKDPLAYVRLAAALSPLQADWVMAGDGPLLADAKGLAKELSARIRFLGWQNDPRGLLNGSDIYVSTSLWEGLPLTLLEAAAAGVPLVATDVPGNRDISERGVPIQLVSPEDHVELQGAVERLVSDDKQRNSIGRRTKEAAAAYFDVERMANETRKVYEELLNDPA